MKNCANFEEDKDLIQGWLKKNNYYQTSLNIMSFNYTQYDLEKKKLFLKNMFKNNEKRLVLFNGIKKY